MTMQAAILLEMQVNLVMVGQLHYQRLVEGPMNCTLTLATFIPPMVTTLDVTPILSVALVLQQWVNGRKLASQNTTKK